MVNTDTSWEKNRNYFEVYDIFQLQCSKRYPLMLKWHYDMLNNRKNILEIGAGSGNLTLELLKNKQNVIAVDINPYALDILKIKCSNYLKNLSIYNLDLVDFSDKFENQSFDGASSMIVHPFPKNNEKLIQNVYNLLKPNGIYVVSAWSCVNDIKEGVIDFLENEIKDSGLLEKYLNEWEFTKSCGDIFAKEILDKNLRLESYLEFFSKVGFREIKVYKSSYENYVYAFTCIK